MYMYTVNNQQFLHVLYLHCFASNTTYVHVFVHVDVQNKINTFVMPQGRLVEALTDYPETCAVLVRRHGVYVWGDTWQKAKTMYVTLLFTC